jgi:hypothetical protein
MTGVLRPATLPATAPVIDPETQPYWDAAATGQLVLPRCGSCGRLFWYPRGACPHCASTDVQWQPSDGHGTVYSFSVVRRAAGAWAEATPYVLAYITLAEQITLVANIVDCEPTAVAVGMSVTAVFEQADDGTSGVLRFVPTRASTS